MNVQELVKEKRYVRCLIDKILTKSSISQRNIDNNQLINRYLLSVFVDSIPNKYVQRICKKSESTS